MEQEHEDRIGFLREKHELEGRIVNLQDMLEASAEQESIVAKLKKDLKRAKALLKDAHCVAENTQTEGTSNIIMRQLKQQVKNKVDPKMVTLLCIILYYTQLIILA